MDFVRIDLGNLHGDAAAEMLRNLMPDCQGLTADAIDQAVETTGGNPQIIQQLVDVYKENGTLYEQDGQLCFDVEAAQATSLPISIEEAIDARIAGLEPLERHVLEVGAVFGNVFWLGAVCALHRLYFLDEPTRQRELSMAFPEPGETHYRWTNEEEQIRSRICEVIDDLVARDYILQLDAEDSTIAGDVELVFKHNLERDLIIKSVEDAHLARYYENAAQWLEMNLRRRSEEHYELLATLHERAGSPTRAARFYRIAAQRAQAGHSNQEAVELYERALALYAGNDAPARLEILEQIGSIFDLIGDIEPAQKRYAEMLQLSWLFDNRAKAATAHCRIASMLRTHGQYGQAMEHLREANMLFRLCQDTLGVATSLDLIGSIHWLRGAYQGALDFHKQSLELRRASKSRSAMAESFANIGRVYMELGQFDDAIRHFKEALETRREIQDLKGSAYSLCDLGSVCVDDNKLEAALAMFSEAFELATRVGDRRAEIIALSRMGQCYGLAGEMKQATQRLRDATELAKQLASRELVSECCRRLAVIYLQMNKAASSQECARLALSAGESIGSKRLVGSAHRVLGEAIGMSLSEADADSAEEHFALAEEALAEIDSRPELAKCYNALAAFHELLGNRDLAAEYRQKANGIMAPLRTAAKIVAE